LTRDRKFGPKVCHGLRNAETSLQILIVGGGKIALAHYRTLSTALPSAKFHILTNRKLTALDCTPESVTAPEIELLSFDLAVIANKNADHYHWVDTLIRLRTPLIFVEKPLCVNLAQLASVRKIIANQSVSNVFVSSRFINSPTLQEIRQDIDLGNSRIMTVEASLNWKFLRRDIESTNWKNTSAEAGGGILLQQGIHALDVINSFGGTLLNFEVEKVDYLLATYYESSIELKVIFDSYEASLSIGEENLFHRGFVLVVNTDRYIYVSNADVYGRGRKRCFAYLNYWVRRIRKKVFQDIWGVSSDKKQGDRVDASSMEQFLNRFHPVSHHIPSLTAVLKCYEKIYTKNY
jgi:predicted dehydrogenase